jgi:hypothetical protein
LQIDYSLTLLTEVRFEQAEGKLPLPVKYLQIDPIQNLANVPLMGSASLLFLNAIMKLNVQDLTFNSNVIDDEYDQPVEVYY